MKNLCFSLRMSMIKKLADENGDFCGIDFEIAYVSFGVNGESSEF